MSKKKNPSKQATGHNRRRVARGEKLSPKAYVLVAAKFRRVGDVWVRAGDEPLQERMVHVSELEQGVLYMPLLGYLDTIGNEPEDDAGNRRSEYILPDDIGNQLPPDERSDPRLADDDRGNQLREGEIPQFLRYNR